ncbi:hypothetical protein DVW12_17125 [Clostridium botulinum]|nr:hypothetical protein [Clostridium botulinum]
MIINKINIEGICTEDELAKISVKGGNIVNRNIDIKVKNNEIKDIMEISLENNIEMLKILNFQDKKIGVVTANTEFNILIVENNENNILAALNEKIYFTYTIDISENIKSKENIYIKIIDCYFKVENNKSIVGTLTYLIKEKEEKVLIDGNDNRDIKQYRLIDVCQEFY